MPTFKINNKFNLESKIHLKKCFKGPKLHLLQSIFTKKQDEYISKYKLHPPLISKEAHIEA